MIRNDMNREKKQISASQCKFVVFLLEKWLNQLIIYWNSIQFSEYNWLINQPVVSALILYVRSMLHVFSHMLDQTDSH